MRVSIFFGTLFLFLNCSSQIPSSWVLRDIQSLDVKIMNTKQWLKTEKSNYKYLNKVMRSELSFYRKNDFRVFQDLNREMELINKCLEKVKSSLSKQMKLATKIKKRPSLGIFDGKQSQQKKNSLFSKKKNNLSIVNKSDKAIKVIKSLEKNSISILESQSDYNSSIESLTAALKKKRSRLVFIRKQVIQWNQQLKEFIHVREKLVPTIDNFNLILSEALFKSAESSYAKNIIDLSKLIEKYNDEMDSFESYVNNIESIAGKQVKGLVYIIKDTEEKNYEKKYKKGLINYQNILKEIPKLINSA